MLFKIPGLAITDLKNATYLELMLDVAETGAAERQVVMDCFGKIRHELEHPVDRFSKRLIVDSIKMFLDYCARYYERQFITRGEANHDLLKQETGQTALGVIHRKAMELAKQQLAATRMTVNEISYNLGFQYSQHFTRLFKREAGITPGEYRREIVG